MATSRTGTSKYLRNRRRLLTEARSHGLTHCPGYERRSGSHRGCGRELDYDTPRLDGSAEADHIVDVQYGGSDDVDNLRVLCRACNLERSRERLPGPVPEASAFATARAW